MNIKEWPENSFFEMGIFAAGAFYSIGILVTGQ